MALDVKKALVRVEFPVFPEGCKDKTFWEVYQLNARVSFFGWFMLLFVWCWLEGLILVLLPWPH